jgi:hypothetical protein
MLEEVLRAEMLYHCRAIEILEPLCVSMRRLNPDRAMEVGYGFGLIDRVTLRILVDRSNWWSLRSLGTDWTMDPLPPIPHKPQINEMQSITRELAVLNEKEEVNEERRRRLQLRSWGSVDGWVNWWMDGWWCGVWS